MDRKLERLVIYLMPVWMLLLFFAFNPRLGPNALNRTVALVAVALVGITFIIGPLSKFVKAVNRYKIYRKYLGLSAFLLMVFHAMLSVVFFYSLDLSFMLSAENPRMLQVYSAIIAFLIFFLMAITSTVKAIRLLGPKNWKLLQTTGYIAMAFVMLHFMLANTDDGVFHIGIIYTAVTFVFGIVVIAARILVLVLASLEKKPSTER